MILAYRTESRLSRLLDDAGIGVHLRRNVFQ